jgi:hypothetical protein
MGAITGARESNKERSDTTDVRVRVVLKKSLLVFSAYFRE